MAARKANGLTENEDISLRRQLRRLDALRPGYAYLGAGERRVLDAIASDIRTRVDPIEAETLAARAEEAIAPLREHTEWAPAYLAALENAE
jgi:hypothetical protein